MFVLIERGLRIIAMGNRKVGQEIVKLVRKKAEKIYKTFQTSIVYFCSIENMDTRESSIWCPPTMDRQWSRTAGRCHRARHFVRDGHVMT